MPRIWNGKNLDSEIPELGLRLEFASLIPEFVDQLVTSQISSESDNLLITPLDDLKAWLRTQNPGESGLKFEVRELLIGQEEKDRTKAAGKGLRFDLVEYELTQMQADPTYEQFNAEWARNIFALALEEADSLQAWAKAELETDFSLSLGFSLPDPRRHPLFKLASIEEALQKFGASKGKRPEASGSLVLDFAARGQARPLKPTASTGVVVVGLADPRAGDATDASLCLVYPREWEGYFLMSFDALRQELTLKEEP